jgi:hypothetical protein
MFYLQVKYEYVKPIRTRMKTYRSVFVAAIHSYTQTRSAVWMDEETRWSTVFIRVVQINRNLQLLCSDLPLPWNATQGCSFAASVSVTLHSQPVWSTELSKQRATKYRPCVYVARPREIERSYENQPKAGENCALLDYYAASGCNFFTDVSGPPIGPICKGQESKKQD